MTGTVGKWSSRFLVVSLWLLLAGLGCGGEVVEFTKTPVGRAERAIFVTSTPGPRPTLWPTFTPVVTVAEEFVLTPTPDPGVVPTPVFLGGVEGEDTGGGSGNGAKLRLADVGASGNGGEDVEAIPSPVPGVGIGEQQRVDTVVVDDREVPVPQGERVDLGDGMGYLVVRLKALFPYQYEEPPRFLTHGDVGWPGSVELVSRGSRYVYWAIEFDDSNASEGWTKNMFWRWVDDEVFAETGKVMLEAPTQAREGSYTIYLGVGRAAPGFWRAGSYTVLLMDSEFNELVSSSFEVR